jgi:hypothetical protein
MKGIVKFNQSYEIVRAELQLPRNRIAAQDAFDNTQPVQSQIPNLETPSVRDFHDFAVAYREAEGEVGQNRILHPQGRWKKLADASQKASTHLENHDELRQHDLESVIREHYNVVRSESNILNPSWLSRQLFNVTRSGFKGEEAERVVHIAVFRESIQSAIEELESINPSEQPGGLSKSTINEYIRSYRSILSKLPESAIKPTEEQKQKYWESVTQRHPTKAPENWFSEETANALGVVTRLAMLSPAPQPVREQPGIVVRVNAERTARAYPAQTETASRPSAAVDEVLSDLSTALNLTGPAEVCFDLENLNRDLSRQMDIARPALQEYQAVSGEELADFGNKHANLVRQARLIDALESSGAQLGVHVPMPQGVRTQQVHALLHSKAPEVYIKWADLGEAYKTYGGNTPFLQTEQAKTLLQEIDTAIAKAFDGNTFESLGATRQMIDWLKSIRQRSGYLMVRSTGAEDSKESANAGGNLSEAYVSPDEVSVSRSLGNVVRSYFGAGSLQNRINAGRNPFAEELKLAMTMQELIGEEVGGAQDLSRIPRSLVLFTNEPIWVGGEEFRVMRLSATYGHGEGVVGNQGIAGDTILVLNSLSNPGELHIIYDNQNKPTRLAPVRSEDGLVTLKQIPNPPELRQSRVFSEQEIARLFQWGIVGESYFGGPTDMEIVVRGDTVYPVQARPVNRPVLLPSYIDLSKAQGVVQLETMRANAFVPGKGSVVEITHPDQVLIADTLEAAENVFIKGQHKVVVVSQKEPANSHPVVNFSSMGMVCLAVPADRQEQFRSWLSQLGDKSLAVCPQSGALYLTLKEELGELISNGFVAHPAQTTRSLDLPEPLVISLTRTREVPKEIEDLLMAVNTATATDEALKYLQELCSSTWNQEFRQRREELAKRLASMHIKPKEALKILEASKQLEAEIDRAFKEAELALKGERGRLRALFQLKSLGGLLFERQSEALNQFSLANIPAALDAANEIADYQAGLANEAQFADILLEGQRTPDSSVYPLWKEFLTKLEALPPEETAAFKEMISELKSSGEVALWMTLFFRKGYDGQDVPKALSEFSAHFPESDKPTCRAMISYLEQTRQLRTQLMDFGELEKFEAAFKRLKAMQSLMTAEALGIGGGAVLNSVRLRLMDEFVDLYDSAIKALKVSQKYSDQEKAVLFKKMLIPYTEMMADWAVHLIDAKSLRESNLGLDLEIYVGYIKRWLAKTDTNPKMLTPSPTFSVLLAKLGGSTDKNKILLPVTLEDFFTLSHQNLLEVIGRLYSKLEILDLIEGDELGVFKYTSRALSTTRFSTGSGYSIVGEKEPLLAAGRLTEESISLEYHIPMRSHSMNVQVRYDKGARTVTLGGDCFGGFGVNGNEHDRWDHIAILLDIIQMAGGPKLVKPTIIDLKGLHFAFEVTSEQIEATLANLQYFVTSTFSPDVREIAKKVAEILMSSQNPEVIAQAKNELLESTDPVRQRIGRFLVEALAVES